MEPVVSRTKREAGCDLNRFMARAADLEKRLAVLPEKDLLVVQLARPEHHAVRVEHLIARQAVEVGGRRMRALAVDEGPLHRKAGLYSRRMVYCPPDHGPENRAPPSLG